MERAVSRIFMIAAALLMLLSASGFAQRIAVLTPAETELCRSVAEAVVDPLQNTFQVDDLDLSRSAAASVNVEDAFNMRTTEARDLGNVIGTSYFVLIKSGSLRRTSSAVEEYYEAFASVYLVSSATGRLISWKLFSFDGDTATAARANLFASADLIAADITAAVRSNARNTSSKNPIKPFPPVPDEGTPGFEGLRPPMPYRRIRPEYTAIANLYSVRATVEIEADVDAEGRIVNTEIVRWAGYALDESVRDTVLKMNWRPATLGKKALPMGVLLRYNFVKLEKDEDR